VLVAGAVWGATLAIAPYRVIAALGVPQPPPVGLVTAARVLGVRHLLQAAILERRLGHRPGSSARPAGAVDLLHAASMLALAAVDPPRRRPALVSATVATALAIGELWIGELIG
jgi:hypothetical protein